VVASRDPVDVLTRGRFAGGPGWDDVGSQNGGVFNGNKGNDSIKRRMTPYNGLSAGRFDGGLGKDMAALCLSGVGTIVSVEMTNDIDCTVTLL